MANTVIAYQEIRFDVRDEKLTHVYVLIDNLSRDGLLGVQGWHYKAFPASTSVMEIMELWANGAEDPLMWPQKAPQS